MKLKEFIEKGKIYLIISIYNDFYLKVYKTSNISFYGENEHALLIKEGDLHHEILPLSQIEINEFYLRYYEKTYEGDTSEILICDSQNHESLFSAWEKLGEICNNLDEIKSNIQDFRNLIYYDSLEKKRYNEQLNKQ